MVRPKRTQTRVVGIMNEMHPYTFYHRIPVIWELDIGMHLVCYLLVYVFCTSIPTCFFNFSCFLYLRGIIAIKEPNC